jgi:hypothetical protein
MSKTHYKNNDFDFDFVENGLPPKYMEYLDNLMKESYIKFTEKPDSFGNFGIQIIYGEDTNKNVVYGLQGGFNSETQFLFFNKSHFLFNMVPLSNPQQIYLANKLFRKYFLEDINRLLNNSDFDLDNENIETRSILSDLY